jgi:hypothetical protein
LMKFISSLCLFFLYFSLLCVAFFNMYGIVKAEDLTTSNLAPSMSDMTASDGTSIGSGYGCSQGQYCTSGTNEGGGTYTSTFDVPLTEAELNQGFTLNSGITINSHSSNSRLPTCANGVLQSGDCRDIFKLTIKLKDGTNVVESFVHQEELTWSGLKDFNYADTVGTNNYGILTGVLELYGIDAGYPVGYYGPQFSDPSITIDYQTALVIEDVTTVIDDIIQTETETTIMDTTIGGTDITPPSTTATVTIPVFQTYTSVASVETIEPPISEPVVAAPTMTTAPVVETTIEAPVVEPVAPAAPTIAPVAQQTETQQAETQQAETQIETAMQPVAAEPSSSQETASEPTSESTPAPKAVAKAKPQKAKTQRKTVSSSTTVTVPVSVPVTPAVAAQTIVNNIAPSQKYGNNAQTVTLVAMGMIANNRGLFKSPSIPDAANFFSSSSVPDGPSMIDPMQNYQVFGQSNGLHNELVESQWEK